MLKNDIIREIEQRVMSAKKKDYSIWIIGITENTEQRREQHKNDGKDVRYWMEWKADSEQDARDIESYFIKKGMEGGKGGGNYPTLIYIF